MRTAKDQERYFNAEGFIFGTQTCVQCGGNEWIAIYPDEDPKGLKCSMCSSIQTRFRKSPKCTNHYVRSDGYSGDGQPS